MNKFLIFALLLIIACSKNEQIEQKNKPKLFSIVESSTTGVHFNNTITEDIDNFFAVFNYAYNGGGVAVGDINNDGLQDIYFTGNQVEDKLYLNKGNFIFEDITVKAKIKNKTSWHNGVVMADVNADGYLDIYIAKGGFNNNTKQRENLLYINNKDNTFTEKGKEFGLNDTGYSMMASFFDADNDNDLDMYLINRPNNFFLSYEEYSAIKKQKNKDYLDKLYINENGKFIDKTNASGIGNNLGYGLGLTTSDLDKDGNNDIFVSNDYYEQDYMLMKNNQNKYQNVIKTKTNHTAFYGMGVDVVDINNDGLEDIIELDMSPESYERSKTNMASMNVKEYNYYLEKGLHNQYMHNMLLLNRGKGYFSEISQLAGIAKTDWSWSVLGSDFDNDGLKDLFVTNGYKRDIWNRDANAKYKQYTQRGLNRNKSKNQIVQEIADFFPSNKLQNYIFKNNGDFTFKNTTLDWGLNKTSFSNGAAYADLDNDGDLDLIVNNVDDKAFIYQNNSNLEKNNYLRLKFKGPKNNQFGLGTKITLYYNDSIQYQEFKTVRGYLSSVEPIAHFGLGKTKNIDSIQVIWPDKKVNNLVDIKTNQLLNIDYSSAINNTIKSLSKETLLTNVTKKLITKPYKHEEIIYDDFKDQVLIPHKISQEGPAITVADINNDGLEDFFVGGAKDQSAAIYIQTNAGQFVRKNQAIFNKDAKHEDVGAVFFDADNDNDLDLFVVSGSNEFDISSPLLQDRLYTNEGNGNFIKSNKLPKISESGSVVLPIDFDKDGDLDLFIGGRLIPKTYPFAPKSFLLENNKGVFTDVTDKIAPDFKNLGMVTSAVWEDIDNDNNKELIVVGEWMPITIFNLEKKTFKNITTSFNLENTNGWWNKIEASDLDNDGDIDFVIGNLGLNYKFSASKEKPFNIYASDFDKNGTNDIFLAKYYKNREVPIRGKQCATEQMPVISRKFKTYQDFANADINEIIGEEKSKALKYQVKEFASIILRNNNGKLEIEKLPLEAQFSTINGIVIEDFNKDGIKDILISGNKFDVEIETTRADASIGLLLLGNDQFNYTPTNHLDSGYFMPFNVKDAKKIKLKNNRKGVLTAVNNGVLQIHSTN